MMVQPGVVSVIGSGKPTMLDWNAYRQQLLAKIADVAKRSPGTMRG
jgi:hypothetical protein